MRLVIDRWARILPTLTAGDARHKRHGAHGRPGGDNASRQLACSIGAGIDRRFQYRVQFTALSICGPDKRLCFDRKLRSAVIIAGQPPSARSVRSGHGITSRRMSEGGANDEPAVPIVMSLIEGGYADHLLFSSDFSNGSLLKRNDKDMGYAKTLTLFVLKVKKAGASDEVLRQIMNDNPRRFLAFLPKVKRKV
jgi:hypothetical protein